VEIPTPQVGETTDPVVPIKRKNLTNEKNFGMQPLVTAAEAADIITGFQI
jgi:hypothetical protein